MWLINPTIYLLTIVCLYLQKDILLSIIPKVPLSTNTVTVSQYKSKLPSDPKTIIQLYKVYNNKNNDTLKLASSLANFNFKTFGELDEMMTELENTTELSNGLLGRFWRMVTFVNFLWLISIVGLTITFLPAMLQIFGPLLIHLAQIIIELLKLLWIYHEELGYVFLSYLSIQSFHYHKDIGFHLCFTSLFGYCAMFMHTLQLHAPNDSSETSKLFMFCMMGLPTFLLTLMYESDFLGFMFVCLLYKYLGFSIMSRGLCWCIGFNDEQDMNQTLGASLILIPLYFLINENTPLLKHFQYGIYVFAVPVYFLSLLIKSSVYVSKKNDYVTYQLMMILSLLMSMCCGSFCNISSLYNVGATFMFFYLGEKVQELDIWKNNAVILIFLGFLVTYFVSLWLNTHPAFLMSVIKGK